MNRRLLLPHVVAKRTRTTFIIKGIWPISGFDPGNIVNPMFTKII
jgi:hypothetical protein